MLNDEVRVKLVDIAWEIVKVRHDLKVNNTAALAKHLSETYRDLYRHVRDIPDFQDDIWRFGPRKN